MNYDDLLFHLQTVFGLLLSICGLSQMLAGVHIFPRLSFAYTLLSSYFSLLSLFFVFDVNLSTWPLRKLMRVHGAVVASIVVAAIASRSRRLTGAVVASFCGVLGLSVLECFLKSSVEIVNPRTLVMTMVMSFVCGIIFAIYDDTFKLLTIFVTSLIGFGLFSNGVSVLLAQPLYEPIAKWLMGQEVVVSRLQQYIVSEAAVLAILCAICQSLYANRSSQECKRTDTEKV